MMHFAPACIHGRFQVIHNDHFRYFTEARRKYERIYVGLTGLRMHIGGSDGREALVNNPLTYAERVAMWKTVLGANGFQPADYEIGPFPIEAPQQLVDFVPQSCICATTIRESWNKAKVSALIREGYTVDVLYEDQNKPLSGSQIRELMRRGDEKWRALVPQGVEEFLVKTDILDRMITPMSNK